MNLNDAIIGLLATIACVIAATLGMLMVVSPAKLIAFGAWIGRLMGFRETDIQWDGSKRREWQIGGSLVAIIAIVMAIFALQVFLSAIRSTSVLPMHDARPNSTRGFYAFFSGVATFFVGAFVIVRSRPLFLGMQARSGFSPASSTSSQWIGILVVRFVGTIFVLGALILMWRWMSA